MSDERGLTGRKNVATFDERRNTSRVWGIPPTALPEALDALRRLRVEDPALVAWIAAGAPRLSHAEHVERFGRPYGSTAASSTPRPATTGLVDERAGDRQITLGDSPEERDPDRSRRRREPP